jgi:riboflavin synthase
MFTGIITDIGTIRSVAHAGDTRFEISTGFDTAQIVLGASIACSGACLTVIETGAGWFAIEASAETLSKTSLGSWQTGTRINLEQALRIGDELGGHIVSGHVDGLARVVSITAEGDSHRVVLETPPELAKFIAPKGSVALNGVSLTVNEVDDIQFGVNIISHTWAQTTFDTIAVDDHMNMEIDMLARYVARMLEAQQ